MKTTGTLDAYFCLIIGPTRTLPDGVNVLWRHGALKLEGWHLYRYVFQPHPTAANWVWRKLL